MSHDIISESGIELNISFNHSDYLEKVSGFRFGDFDNKTTKEIRPIIKYAIDQLLEDPDLNIFEIEDTKYSFKPLDGWSKTPANCLRFCIFFYQNLTKSDRDEKWRVYN